MMKITYLGHSGFLVELESAYLLFDFYKGELPQLTPEKRLYVFVSHAHFDHFREDIFKLREHMPRISFVLSNDVETEVLEDIIFMKPSEERNIEDIKVRTLRSTDQGVAFLVYMGQYTIYHAGDLNWWHWKEEGETFNTMMRRNFQYEINKLQDISIDVAFLPLDPRQDMAYDWGLRYFMKGTRTKAVFPMHFWGHYEVFDRLALEEQSEEDRQKIYRIEREGQVFNLEDPGQIKE